MSTTVITAAAGNRLVREADVRADLGLAATVPTQEALLRMIDQASARVASLCNRTFGRQTYRERFNAWDLGCGIVLSEGPVIRIVSVTLGGTVVDPAEFEMDGLSLHRIAGGYRCGWFGRGMVVEYGAGWQLPGEPVGTPPAPPLPADVEKAAIQLIAVAISEAGRDMTIRQEMVEGVGSTSYYVQGSMAALPHPGAEAALMPYRKLVLV